MNICVLGLWHLGTVTAACLASAGHRVIGLDFDEETIRNLQEGQPPLFEPGLEDLVKKGLKKKSLSFTTDIHEAVKDTDVVWVTYDTPVDDDDRADVAFVTEGAKRLFAHIPAGALVLVSSQLPVGSTHLLEEACPNKQISFAYSPENLRLGKAISVFTEPDRVVVGVRNDADQQRIAKMLSPFTENIEWMSVESAEMTKHALNAFLATSVVFINEIATICEQVGADSKEVERGLKSEARIGKKAYLSPGGAFAGGTLARDISFLKELGEKHGQQIPMLSSVQVSNSHHKDWVRRKLLSLVDGLKGKTIAVWGLTYKPGTDTLRRSTSVETCQWLAEQGALVRAHDPAVKNLPEDLKKHITLCETEVDALTGASSLVVATPWPQYQDVSADKVTCFDNPPTILDPNRFLVKTLGADSRLRYFAVGGV